MNTNIIALSPEVQKRYKEKVDIIGGEDPNTVLKKDLSSDPEHFPHVTYPDIVNYLIFNPSPYTKDDLKSYKGLAAYNQFLQGWVREVGVKVYGENILVKAKVGNLTHI